MSDYVSPEQYLDSKVKPIFEPMLKKIVIEKPDNPIPYMIDCLAKLSGRNNNKNSEKEELIDMRKKVEKFRKMYDKYEEQIYSASDSEDEETDEEEIKDAFNQLNLTKKAASSQNQAAKPPQNLKNKRTSVSAEVYGQFNLKKTFVPKVIPKTEEQINRIRTRMQQCFIFSALEEKDILTVIDAMEEKKYQKFDKVIQQGDQGDCLFLVDSGKLDCFKLLNNDDKEATYLKVYLPGEAFGELALLYNAPRAATIIAKENCSLWALDRETFNYIVKDAAVKKREKYEMFLKSVEILKSMSKYELTQISDALKVKYYKQNEMVIKRNDFGDDFFIIEEGEAFATKPVKENSPDQVVKEYKSGDYFGELALIKNDLRAANVIAKTDCKVITLDRKSFKRLLGPVEAILGRLSTKYN